MIYAPKTHHVIKETDAFCSFTRKIVSFQDLQMKDPRFLLQVTNLCHGHMQLSSTYPQVENVCNVCKLHHQSDMLNHWKDNVHSWVGNGRAKAVHKWQTLCSQNPKVQLDSIFIDILSEWNNSQLNDNETISPLQYSWYEKH